MVGVFPVDTNTLPLISFSKRILGFEIDRLFSFADWGYCNKRTIELDSLCTYDIVIEEYNQVDDLMCCDTIVISSPIINIPSVQECIKSVVERGLLLGKIIINMSTVSNQSWNNIASYKILKNQIEHNENILPMPLAAKIAITQLTDSNNSQYIEYSLIRDFEEFGINGILIPSNNRIITDMQNVIVFDWENIKKRSIDDFKGLLNNHISMCNKINSDIQIWGIPGVFLNEHYNEIELKTYCICEILKPDFLIVVLPFGEYDHNIIKKYKNIIKNKLNIHTAIFVLGNHYYMFDNEDDDLPLYVSCDMISQLINPCQIPIVANQLRRKKDVSSIVFRHLIRRWQTNATHL